MTEGETSHEGEATKEMVRITDNGVTTGNANPAVAAAGAADSATMEAAEDEITVSMNVATEVTRPTTTAKNAGIPTIGQKTDSSASEI